MPLPKDRKVVLITGATSGFGKACADFLNRKGYKIYGTSRRLNSEIESCKMIQIDVNDEVSVREGIRHIVDEEGRLDVVVNNAGIGVAGSLEDTSIEEMKFQFETNYYGVVRVCQTVLPIMRSQKSGCIINMSSIAGLIGLPFQGAYTASKFALEGFTEALRLEVKPFGIDVVLIEPGDFNTGFTDNRIKTEKSRKSSVYANRFQKAMHIMEKDERNGPNPYQIGVLVDSIINQSSPRSRYMIGPATQRFAVYLKKFLPSQLFEWIMLKNYGI